jgi:hypothetical protein
MKEFSRLEKQLLSASMLGVTFAYCPGGHRWINIGNSAITDCMNLRNILGEALSDRISSIKFYGGIDECIYYIDCILFELGHKSLNLMFDECGWLSEDGEMCALTSECIAHEVKDLLKEKLQNENG